MLGCIVVAMLLVQAVASHYWQNHRRAAMCEAYGDYATAVLRYDARIDECVVISEDGRATPLSLYRGEL